MQKARSGKRSPLTQVMSRETFAIGVRGESPSKFLTALAVSAAGPLAYLLGGFLCCDSPPIIPQSTIVRERQAQIRAHPLR